VFVCTHILTVRTQVFLFKANYGTAVRNSSPLLKEGLGEDFRF